MKCSFGKIKSKAFTIVELLTVMSVIALLLGLLVPSLQEVRKIALNTKQNAQFHSIDVALNIFQGEEEEYPESSSISTNYGCTGAQMLAEALVGRDLQGYDTASSWDPYSDSTANMYNDSSDSTARRKGPYLNLENVGAFDVADLYGETLANSAGIYSIGLSKDEPVGMPAPVLTDVFRNKRVELANGEQVKAGSPVLYFKANTASTLFQSPVSKNNTFSDQDMEDYIYNYMDNYLFFELGTIKKPDLGNWTEAAHPYQEIESGYEDFYEDIWNSQVSTVDRPYNPDTFILMSAGFDGRYGTADDITNFGN